jgi:threonine synthase
MHYYSTRGEGPASLDEALVRGIAGDGGLYLPEKLPAFSPGDFQGAGTIPQVAAALLEPFFEGSSLARVLPDILAETFAFPIPASRLPVAGGNLSLLELYHGPTAAFKDVGAGFLAACLTRLEGDEASPLTILVATSASYCSPTAGCLSGRRIS